MNQQRSRRFRSSQEAKEKEEQRKEAIAMFEGMCVPQNLWCIHIDVAQTALGKPVSEETKNKKSWDSNAITPGSSTMTDVTMTDRFRIRNTIHESLGRISPFLGSTKDELRSGVEKREEEFLPS